MRPRLLSLVLLISCTSSHSTAPAPRHRFAEYDGDVTINPASGQLTASWKIHFNTDANTRDSAVLLLNRGLRVTSLHGTEIRSFTDTATKDTRLLVLHFRAPQQLGTRLEFDVAYDGMPVFGGDSINDIRPNWIELGLDSEWHPVFADYTQRIIGNWRVHLPASWRAVASATTSYRDNVISFQNRIPLIDIAFSAAPSFNTAETAAAGVYYVNTDSATVAHVLATAGSCSVYLNTRYGEHEPLPHARIVLAPRKGPGYARKNYIVITDAGALPPAELGRFLCHEFSHYWSSGANSLGPENWLNEGFAEFVAGRFVRATFGAGAYGAVVQRWSEAIQDKAPVWTPAATQRPGPRIAYRKAPYLLDLLEQRIGSAQMDRVLVRYMTERMATTPDLLRAITEIAGPEPEAWFRDQLAGGAGQAPPAK